ncbi:uncharacterized protein IUM83_16557 [Phytophthora cinnamomi]|uniref:uncharacterized protein n=1 Tax=Phytophthora cinnamomi TaxID=4785 RepID=UPI00355AB08B|nr:hypothetical protein IUM83_16557 [Phytophthora cinnamomi]
MQVAIAESARLTHGLAAVIRERDQRKRGAQYNTEFVSSLRKTVCTQELQLREATRQANRRVDSSQVVIDHQVIRQRDKDLERLGHQLVERDVAYSALQGVASSYFERVQEAARVVSSGGADRALRIDNHTIEHQCRVIQRQKNILRHQDHISVTDPTLAVAAAAGVDAPGLSTSELALNARLCRLLEAHWPELAQIPTGESREITLRVSGAIPPIHTPPSDPSPSQASTSGTGGSGKLAGGSYELDESSLDLNVPSLEPRRVPESRYRRDHLTPATPLSAHLPPASAAGFEFPIFSACVDGWGSFREFFLGVRGAGARLVWIADSSLVVPSGTEVGCTYYAVSSSPEVGGFQALCAIPEISYRYTTCSFLSQDSG